MEHPIPAPSKRRNCRPRVRILVRTEAFLLAAFGLVGNSRYASYFPHLALEVVMVAPFGRCSFAFGDKFINPSNFLRMCPFLLRERSPARKAFAHLVFRHCQLAVPCGHGATSYCPRLRKADAG